MSRVTSKMRSFAERVIAIETKGTKSSEVHAVFHFTEKLRPHLSNLMGNTGFRALLARSLALAGTEAASVRAVHVKTDGSLGGLDEIETEGASDEFSEGAVILLAQLLGLLVAFIGENLTLSIVREVWPKLTLNDLNFGNGD